MNLGNIMILLLVISLLVLSIIFLFLTFKKQKQAAVESLIRDLNIVNNKYKMKTLDEKELPVKLEEINSDFIYFCNKVVIGQYDRPNKIIHEKNHNISKSIKNNKLEIFFHYYSINFKRQKFVPLNKIDLLVSDNNIYLHHPLEPEKINLSDIKTITFFWEKNSLIKSKEYYPAVSFTVKNKYYFLLFQTYNETLKFIACVNNFDN